MIFSLPPPSTPARARAIFWHVQDPGIRSSLSLDIEGAVIIFDEAHNVEGVCRDAGSLELSVLDMTNIASDLCRFCQISSLRWVGFVQ